MLKTFQILISGQVQGVGFRPYVFALAKDNNLKGEVSNNETGVIIIVSGTSVDLGSFCNQLTENPPPASIIEQFQSEEIEFQEFEDFRIIQSKTKSNLSLRLTPDFAICEACSFEIQNAEDRRYQYAFTTCVNCGPRWSVTKKFPFEREHTSIAGFVMCKTCLTEYKDPSDRRFHSQRNRRGE
ncbi:acylphosphatase [Aegicerativicinus sediminis]